MAYDPNLPANGSQISSAELRGQLAGLNDLIYQRPTNADVNDLISQSSASNVDAVAPLTLTISNPPTQAQVQAILNAMNSLIQALQH